MSEEWRPISFAHGYQASSLGNILGKRGRLMKPTLNSRGYFVCDLNFVQHRVNRIICRVFHGEPPTNEHHAAHRDSNQQNNEATNLYWATPLENRAVLTEDDVRLIRQLREEGYSVTLMHEILFTGISYSTISQAANRRTWRHV